MQSAQAFQRQLMVASAGLSPEQINIKLAAFAKDSLASAISDGEASGRYVRSVNGVIDAAEESVQAPGPIIYQFLYLEEATRFALEFAKARSPKSSGAYQSAWFALVNGQQWDEVSPIALDAEVIVTNDEPYARKIEVGSMTMSVPPHITEDASQAIRREYSGSVSAKVSFVDLAGAYRLRRDHSKHGRHKGDPITYPAVILGTV